MLLSIFYPIPKIFSVIPCLEQVPSHRFRIRKRNQHCPARSELVQRRAEKPNTLIDEQEAIVNRGALPGHYAYLDGIETIIQAEALQCFEKLLSRLWQNKALILVTFTDKALRRRQDLNRYPLLSHSQNE